MDQKATNPKTHSEPADRTVGIRLAAEMVQFAVEWEREHPQAAETAATPKPRPVRPRRGKGK